MVDQTRRRLLAAVAGAAGVAGCADQRDRGTEPRTSSPTATASPSTGTRTRTSMADGPVTPEVGLETVADGLRAPLALVAAPDADRRYVAEQQGVAWVHEADGLRDRPFLDLREAVTTGGEKGLLGLALHPEFPGDRRVFVRYSAPPREGTPGGYSHTFVLASFEVADDGRRVRSGSGRSVLEIPEPQSNHNAGDLAFGPDGYLYVGVGDGGAGGDQGAGHVEDWYDGVGGGNGQDVERNLLGSVLRIDVDAGGRGAYAVPTDNPLVGESGLDEQYAWGFRNPWRLSFDGDDLLVGDVGQTDWEEVDLVERGGNYGWNVKEGTHCYRAADCPDETPDGEPLLDPVLEYPHGGQPVSGNSVIGGYVYRGSAMADLEGTYVFGDYSAGGQLFVAWPRENPPWPTEVLPFAEGDRPKLNRLLSFGRASDDELYALGTSDDGDGGVHRLVTRE